MLIRRFPVRRAESVCRSTLTRNYIAASYGVVRPTSREYFATCCSFDTLLEGKTQSIVDVKRVANGGITWRLGCGSSGRLQFPNHLFAGNQNPTRPFNDPSTTDRCRSGGRGKRRMESSSACGAGLTLCQHSIPIRKSKRFREF